MTGIHARQNEGAFSVVLSGNYSEDRDDGDEFVYSGCGGRNLSGNKRTTKHPSCDQKLTPKNKGLTRNCDPKDWRKGKPVRVVNFLGLCMQEVGLQFACHV